MANDSKFPVAVVVGQISRIELDVTFSAKAHDVLDEARDYVIDSPEVRSLADSTLVMAKSIAKRVEEVRKAAKAPYMEAGKVIDDFYGQIKGLADQAAKELQSKILTYDRHVAEERARAQVEAEEAARKEKARLQAEAEAAARAGNTAAADSFELAAVMVQAPIIPLGPDKSETKSSHRVNWSAEVVDFAELVRAVAVGAVPLEALEPNMTYLNARARADKEALKISGVKPVGTESLSAKRAA